MVRGYEAYCLADPLFYDTPTVIPKREPDFPLADAPVPDGWKRGEIDDWVMLMPAELELPHQGWKIHASACLDNAAEVVDVCARYCIENGIAFKFIPNRRLFLIRNLKYAHRSSSGKLVTIYPLDVEQCERIVNELAPLLDGQPGPYILSDLRIGPGPLYVRYGGYTERFCIGPSGVQELAIADAEGRLVPDRRGPVFQLPEWVELPAFLQPHFEARGSATVDDLPCTVESALHFSNSGGVYLGTDKATGDKVVVKEARPYAGLAVDGSHAVTRLERERRTLERLAGLDGVPKLYDYRVVGEHHFLVEEYVEGDSVHTCLAKRSPLVLQDLTDEDADSYAAWAMDMCHRIEAAIDQVHQRGMAILDLHPSNVLVRPDGRICLIDLEFSAEEHEDRAQALADPGFLAPSGATGTAVDRHALACLRLYVFMPLTMLFALYAPKAEHLAEEIAELFPTAREFVREAGRVISAGARGVVSVNGSPPVANGNGSAPVTNGSSPSGNAAAAFHAPLEFEPTPEGWARARESMVAAILASATPKRNDRLFPGDPEQFQSGGLNFAHGAAGVLYALDITGGGRYADHEEWLVQRALNPENGTRLGFYDGLHGIAYALEHLGRRDEALAVLDRAQVEIKGKLGHFQLDLRGGLSGIGLNLLHFAGLTDDAALRDAADEVIEMVADRLGSEDSVATTSGGDHPYAGLTRGSSGPALLFMRAYDRTGDERFMELAATAIGQDLRRCIVRPEDGALEVDEGWRSCPYIHDGGVGIGLALQDYLARRPNERFSESLDRVRRAAEARLYVEPGLFSGRAGMIYFLSRPHPAGTATERDPVAAAQIRRLAWHALPYRRGVGFPGEQLLRMSMDLTTGTAGVLLGVGAALHDRPVHLPFLERPSTTESALAATELVSATE
jgi:tRNA A-37 threonylcarbamoyl transferase component Bud32